MVRDTKNGADCAPVWRWRLMMGYVRDTCKNRSQRCRSWLLPNTLHDMPHDRPADFAGEGICDLTNTHRCRLGQIFHTRDQVGPVRTKRSPAAK